MFLGKKETSLSNFSGIKLLNARHTLPVWRRGLIYTGNKKGKRGNEDGV